MHPSIAISDLSLHVTRFVVPTPTLPPAFHTNSYLISSQGHGLLVDAGTRDEAVLQQLTQALRHRVIQHLTLVATHYHRDHTHGLDWLSSRFDAPIHVHQVDLDAAARELNLAPETLIPMQPTYHFGDVTVQVKHLPGHTHGHVHLRVEPDGVILVGDHLAGTGSVWIGPPDGHLNDYLKALDDIVSSGCRMAAPGHGDPLVPASDAAIRLKERRLMREQQIIELLEQTMTQADIVDTLYGDTVPEAARWVAARTVQGHLQRLIESGQVTRVWNPEELCFSYSAVLP